MLFSLVMDLQAAAGNEQAQAEVVRTYEAFVARVEDLKLDERAFEKPRLDVGPLQHIDGISPS